MWMLAACAPGVLDVPGGPSGVPEPVDPGGAGGRPRVDTTVVPPYCDDRWPIVRISEVVPGNVSGMRDADDDTSDWIELVAAEGAEIAGYALAAGNDTWELPALVLDPGAFLLVFASGKDRTEGELHATFKVDAGGEDLAVLAPDGCPTDELEMPFVPRDFSWGRVEELDHLEFFAEPTPGTPNDTEHHPGFAATPVIDPPSGWGSVVATVTGNGEVRTTMDGSVPAADDPLGDAPIALDPPPGGFAVLRARAFEGGLWPSAVATATWGDDAVLADGIGVLSLVADPADLFSVQTGIWAFGPPDFQPWYPYFGANFWEDWERDVRVVAFAPSGAVVADQDAGIAIHGGYSRAFDQRGLHVVGRDEYGDATFDHAFFSDEEVSEYRSLQLHNGGDWCSTHLFDAYMHDVLRDAAGTRYAAIDAQAYEPVDVWLNGEYWGLYGLRERVDEHYVAGHHPVDPDALDRVELGAAEEGLVWDLEQGTWDAFDTFNAFALSAALSDPAQWAQFEALAEPESLAAYVVAETYASNSDWWWNNIRMWRPRTADGRWRWIVHDTGHGWPDPTWDHMATTVTWSDDGLPIANALANDTFRALLANTAAEWLATSMSPEAGLARLDAMVADVEAAMPGQLERWCGTDLSAWTAAVAVARTYVVVRPRTLDTQLMDHLDIADHAALTLDADPPGSGTFSLTAIDAAGPITVDYYRDVPVTVTAVPAPGYAFVGWSDGTNTTEITLPMAADTALVASFH